MDNLQQSNNHNSVLARVSLATLLLSLFCLLILHFGSPEFEPSWRMISEYANGKYKWLLSLFFIFGGIGSMILASILWRIVDTRFAKVGVILLFISGIGGTAAAFFDVNHPLHSLAGLLGVPSLPIAALFISYHLKSKEFWKEHKSGLLISAHATWISLVLMIISMFVMMAGFQNAGISFEEGAKPPKSVPEGVIALGGYANRILVIVYSTWQIFIAKVYLKIHSKS